MLLYAHSSSKWSLHFKPRLKPFPGGLKCKVHFSGSQDSPSERGKTHSQYLPNYGSLYLFIKF